MLNLLVFLIFSHLGLSIANTGDNLGPYTKAFNQCPVALLKVEHKHFGRTGRSAEAVIRALQNTSGLDGQNSLSPIFDLQAIESGEISVLSLGEGRSGLIYKLNEATMDSAGIAPHHAVDSEYLAQGQAYGHRKGMQKFPKNYHAQSVQTLRLETPGLHLTFQEVISSHLVNYLLYQMLQPGNYENHARARNMLGRIFFHLAPGGNFRSIGYLGKLPNEELTVRLFDRLLEEQVISDYGMGVVEDGSGKEVLVIWARKSGRVCGYPCSEEGGISPY